CQHNYGTPWTF
nr:immunoglobulin light chain junction region [Macaca mulatta]MOW61700.1 immunoglobulin light chain junction region [Macaca mulatta]MOW61890.1 immunoglobulin light chain junction region [Macaca mulatta]MOW62178.1 immunoglobulin light chain junction region [Macaca mulatta]MOW62323.1 immunoglobulin light chain junction region [Macaca mulatta]